MFSKAKAKAAGLKEAAKAKAAEIDEKHHLSEKATAAKEAAKVKAQEFDEKHQLSVKKEGLVVKATAKKDEIKANVIKLEAEREAKKIFVEIDTKKKERIVFEQFVKWWTDEQLKEQEKSSPATDVGAVAAPADGAGGGPSAELVEQAKAEWKLVDAEDTGVQVDAFVELIVKFQALGILDSLWVVMQKKKAATQEKLQGKAQKARDFRDEKVAAANLAAEEYKTKARRRYEEWRGTRVEPQVVDYYRVVEGEPAEGAQIITFYNNPTKAEKSPEKGAPPEVESEPEVTPAEQLETAPEKETQPEPTPEPASALAAALPSPPAGDGDDGFPVLAFKP